MTTFKRVFSDAPWEQQIAYCRVLKAGNQLFVTGTAPINPDGSVYAPGDAYEQTKRCLTIIAEKLGQLDCSMANIVRTRMFVTNIDLWQQYGRAHKEFFHQYPPATTMVEVKRLIDPAMLIEIEADGIV